MKKRWWEEKSSDGQAALLFARRRTPSVDRSCLSRLLRACLAAVLSTSEAASTIPRETMDVLLAESSEAAAGAAISSVSSGRRLTRRRRGKAAEEVETITAQEWGAWFSRNGTREAPWMHAVDRMAAAEI